METTAMTTQFNKPTPGIVTGALVGLMVTAPLLALSFLAERLLGLPFVAFDFFDWLARELPGDVIRFGINRMIDLITALDLGETSSIAKSLEHVQAILFVLGIGAVVGAGVFFLLRRLRREMAYNVFLIAGVLLGALFAGTNLSLRSNSAFVEQSDPIVTAVWYVILFTLWGAAMAWIYTDLTRIGETASIESEIKAMKIDRRQFLVQMGGATATLTVIGAGVGALFNVGDGEDDDILTTELNTTELPEGLPNMDADLAPAPGTRLEYTPLDDHYRIDISARPPVINGEIYRLKVGGMVAKALEISLAELQTNYEPMNQYITMECISNRVGGDLISTTLWTGVPMQVLLDEWEIQAGATHLRILGADGFIEYMELDILRDDPRCMLCYAWDGQPLKQKHGFPLRIYRPDTHGMKMPKWITEIEAVDEWRPGYWVERQWDKEALVNPMSVVDTVSVTGAYVQAGTTYIPVGGVAYSGAKGISKVEVSIDDGEWVEAQLREPLSDLTWVIWRYDWAFQPGSHRFSVQCYTEDGTLQPTQQRGTFPNGATGIHTAQTRLPDSVTPSTESTPEATLEASTEAGN